jgi:hypothetical protein
MRLGNSGAQAGAPIKPGLGLDGVEKPLPGAERFLIFSQEPRAKSQRLARWFFVFALAICQLLFANCFFSGVTHGHQHGSRFVGSGTSTRN